MSSSSQEPPLSVSSPASSPESSPESSRRSIGRFALAAAIPILTAGLVTAYAVWSLKPVPAERQQASTAAAAPAAPARPAPPEELQQSLTRLADKFREPVGIAVSEVGKDWIAAVDGSSLFPQQSVSKTWVALTVMDGVDRGRIRLQDPVLMRPEDRSVFYQPIIRRIGRNGYATTVGELLQRAIMDSDNAANDRLLALVGGVNEVQRTLSAKGIRDVHVGGPEHELQSFIAGLNWSPAIAGWKFKEARAQLPDSVRDAAEARYLANPPDGAAPAAVAEALAALHAGKLLSPASTETLLQIMSEVRTGRMRLRAGLPAHWSIAHKTGTGPDWRGGSVGINDVALLTAPDGRTYSVAVMIRRTTKPLGQRRAFMRQVAQAVVDHWNEERRRNQA
jgi:beta-lactamase class A